MTDFDFDAFVTDEAEPEPAPEPMAPFTGTTTPEFDEEFLAHCVKVDEIKW